MAIRVPINPQTRVATGGLGYQRAVDVTAGTRALGQVVREYGEYVQQEEKKKELFDVQKRLVDETNALQLDYEQRREAQPLGAAGFTKTINDDYTVRHSALVAELREKGYSAEAIQEFETRLGTIRSQYVARAIDFQDKSGFAKTVVDSKNLATSLSQYANKNPFAVRSTLDEFRTALASSGLDAIEQETVYEQEKGTILRGAQEGFTLQNPEIVVGLYGLPTELVTTSPTNLPDGQEFDLPSYLAKLSPAEGTGKNKRSSAIGHFQFLDATMLETYKQVFGNTGETNAQILAKRKDKAVMTKLAERFTNNNIQRLVAANLSVNDATVYLSHFLGINDAIKVISAHANETISKLVSSKAIAANPGVFKKIVDAGDLISWAQGKMGGEVQIQQAGPIEPGNINVSQLPAVRNADGTVSTVRSISIEQDGNTYLIPTVINGKVVSDDDAVAAFRETGRHLGMFTDATSADAYAQQLHESEARRVAIDSTGKTGIDVLDLSTGPERMQMLTMARTIMNGREADAKAQQREAHEQWYNGFLNQLQDGKLGQADLNTAYEQGLITDFDERKKAQGILDAKNKKDEDLVRFGVMIRNDIRGNPFDPDAQKAVDEGFDFTVKREARAGNNTSPFLIGLSIWQKTGVLPSQAGVMIRGGLIGTDPATVAASASVASNMLAQNPNAFAGVEGGEDIGKAAATYAHYVDDLGMTAQDAANKIAIMNSPEYQAKTKADEPTRNKFIKAVNENDIERTLNNVILGEKGLVEKVIGISTLGMVDTRRPGAFTNSPQKAEAKQTFTEIALDHYDKYHDPAAATSYAARQMSRFYGVENGRLLKYPASKAYPEIQGSREYIFDQAKEEVDKFAGFEIPKEDIWLQPTANGSTAAAFRSGQRPPYEIHFISRKDGQAIYHHIPGKVFVADIDKARRDAAIEARRVEKRTRLIEKSRQELEERERAAY